MNIMTRRLSASLLPLAMILALPGTAGAAPILSLEDAVALAAKDQPVAGAFLAEARASEEAATAARALPDPQVTAGIQNLPVTGNSALSPTRDEMTMYTIGVMREQVRRTQRDAQAAQYRAEAGLRRAQATAEERRIERDVTVAWINVVEAKAKQRLLDRLIADLGTGRQVIEAGIPTGSSSPALALEAQAEIALAEAQRADAHGQEARARGELSRWIGEAATRPLPETIPALAVPHVMTAGHLTDHPHVRMAQAEQQAAERQIDVARAARRPNLTWSVMYGYRPSYGDMVTAQVSIPLPINRRKLQDRRIAEASARADGARLRVEDAHRELAGAYQVALADYESADAQLRVVLDRAIPSLEASFQAAEARYASGQGGLDVPLNIVERYVQATLQSVELQAKRARAAAELIYLSEGDVR
ncbi:TolC family protein [Sphingomonas parva]|uniref:TolC family protein n=1 Tax=Sphingomonas parva TaxID=2555898 RepID=A0A4Y8ZV26_9SPHN|nr:TolC family protein [Sphingomonas parva]TFI59764.1 TolC family protein [Sphingomonas parva]